MQSRFRSLVVLVSLSIGCIYMRPIETAISSTPSSCVGKNILYGGRQVGSGSDIQTTFRVESPTASVEVTLGADKTPLKATVNGEAEALRDIMRCVSDAALVDQLDLKRAMALSADYQFSSH